KGPSRPAPPASLAALPALRDDEKLGGPRVGGVPVVVAVERLDDEPRLGEQKLGLAAIEIVKRHVPADPMNGSVIRGLVVPEPLGHAVDVGVTGRELADRAPRFGVHTLPLVADSAIEPGDDLGAWLAPVDPHSAPR